MFRIKRVLGTLIFGYSILIPGLCRGDDSDLFGTTVRPDALIMLDMTMSMTNSPIYGHNCPANGGTIDNPCSKAMIAKRAIRDILDADGSGTVVSPTDDDILRVRFGYVAFNGGYENYSNHNSQMQYDTDTPTPTFGIILKNPLGAPYADIYNKMIASTHHLWTPLVYNLIEAKKYLDAHPPERGSECRPRFVILISDGIDTEWQCGGQHREIHSRHAVVTYAKALADAGYKVIVLYWGPSTTNGNNNTMEWAARYGGTDNPAVPNTGDAGAFTPLADACPYDPNHSPHYPAPPDPEARSLMGYAFSVQDLDTLKQSLQAAISLIQAATNSLSSISVVASRTSEENYIYQASFITAGSDPFWAGHLKKYAINSDGTQGDFQWDAGIGLRDADSTRRNILTYQGGSVIAFQGPDGQPWGHWKDSLGVGDANTAQDIIGYIRGDSGKNPDGWRLGDIFHSNPVTIGSPNAYYNDIRSPQAFVNFRGSHSSTDDRPRTIVVGANDGQFHAFDSNGNEKWSFIPPNLLPKLQYLAHTSHPTFLQHTYFVDGPVTVADVWWGTGDGTGKSAGDWHTLLVFGEGKGVRDQTNDASKANYLWSSSQFCASQNPQQDFSKSYSSTYQYYCGYYAFDLTDTRVTPSQVLWRINSDPGTKQVSSSHGPYLGEPWSKMAVGRVWDNGNEKWVGFMGGGYGQSGNGGKGFFVVDLSNGKILWSYTWANNSSMNYIPASPAVADTDNDGFMDTAYVGDLSGNMWRFTFCSQVDEQAAVRGGGHCSTGNWSGGQLFQSSASPIYITAAVARGSSSNLWVFWGTGDKNNPNSTNGGKFFAIKDNKDSGGNWPSAVSSLPDLSVYTETSRGWSMTLGSGGEKVLSEPAVFAGVVLFTTYTPAENQDDCAQVAGTSKLYGLSMKSVSIGDAIYSPGVGVLSSSGDKSVVLGAGMAGAPVLSQKPIVPNGPPGATDLYVTFSPGGDQAPKIISTGLELNATPLADLLKQTAPSAQIIHWRDVRIQ